MNLHIVLSGSTLATLDGENENLRWTAAIPGIAAALNDRLMAADRSPGLGNWRIVHAREIAGSLGGTLEIEGADTSVPNRVY